MPLRTWISRGTTQAGASGLLALRVERDDWHALAESVAAAGGWLAALWASGTTGRQACVHAAYHASGQGLVVTLATDTSGPCPGIDDVFPAAARMQRAMTDLSGVATTASDLRPWLRHSAWPAGHHPLTDPPMEDSGSSVAVVDQYEFVRVAGDGVHEIAVGPVHAGIIEPGHFRFSVVGEKVLRLEERLGYTHKGIESLFAGMQAKDGHRLAARVSGDTAVAFSWAYCQAFEALAGCAIPARAVYLRALCLEIERIQNHLGDLGALGNDAGFAFGLAQFSILKERWLRAAGAALGQRYLMDVIVPGGTRADATPDAARALAGCAAGIAADVLELREIYDEHPGVRDRFFGAGEVKPALARRLGLTGIAGRASGLAFDARIDLATPPYDVLRPARVVLEAGDVAARVAVRFDELQESCRLVSEIVATMPDGPHLAEPAAPAPDTLAVGWIEGWRGSVVVALEAAPGGAVRRCHPHDPSWQNWPALEYAVIGNIVPDFPLINKSFNLSYSGHDL
jgi:Ni,Fe-hydrogenase III large subunit/Ni,Fe-hydrogenase III component G